MKQSFIVLILLWSVHIGFAQKKDYRIGVLFDENRLGTIEITTQKLEKEIKAVVGEDGNIIFNKEHIFINNYNLDIAKNNYKKAIEECDIIISFGDFNSSILREEKSFPRPTLVVGDMRKENTNNTRTSSNIHNLLYLTYSENIRHRLDYLKQISDYDVVGIAIEKHIADIKDFETETAKLLSNSGIKYKIITFSTLEELLSNLDDIDAIELESSSTLSPKEVRVLADHLLKKGISSFSAYGKSHVENGIMATSISRDNTDRFFRRIALSVEAYIMGQDIGDLPIFIDFSKTIVINQSTYQSLGLPINYSILGDIEYICPPNINPIAKKVYSLPELISEVLSQNLDLRSNKKNISLIEQDLKMAKSTYLPEIKASANGVYLDPKVAKISNGQNAEISVDGSLILQQVLYSAEANANIKIQKSLLAAEREKYNISQLDAIFDIATAYFNTLILKTNVKIQQKNLELTKKNLEIAKENYKAGQSSKTDLLRFKSQKNQNTQSLIQAINQLKMSYGQLKQMINHDLNMEIDIRDAALDDEIFSEYNYTEFIKFIKTPATSTLLTDFIIQEAMTHLPEIRQIEYSQQAIRYKKDLYGARRFLPQISLQGQYNSRIVRSGIGSSYPIGMPIPPYGSYSVGINVTIPLFNRNSNSINGRIALLQNQQIEINKENIKTNLSLQIHNKILELINQISNIELSKESVTIAQEALELTQNAYSNGIVNIIQLIDAQNNYIINQQANANAIYNYLIQMLQIERLMGDFFLLKTPDEISDINRRFIDFSFIHSNNNLSPDSE